MSKLNHMLKRGLCTCLLVCAGSLIVSCTSESTPLELTVKQITSGSQHHFFGYIGQSRTIPWNASGRYILAMRMNFHDRLPGPDDPAEIILIDTEQRNKVQVLDETCGWNHQQGTMFYWNPRSPQTQFFFNDRDQSTGKVFTVLFDIEEMKRVREFRFADTPVANGGVAQGGGAFLAINYGRMARLRPVTGYRGAFDWTEGVNAPADDGIFKVDTETGEKSLVVSFQQLAEALRPQRADIDEIPLFVNHTLWNRNDDRIWFYVRGNFSGDRDKRINVPCTIKPDGTGLSLHEYIGGHPEWGEGNVVFGVKDDRQVLYDVDSKEIVGQLGDVGVFPNPGADIAFSPDGKFFVNGYRREGKNYYVIYRMKDGVYVQSEGLSCGGHTRGDLRIDPAPRWNRSSDAILVPGWTDAGTRQMHVIEIRER